MRNKIIPYRSDLKIKARELRKNPTLAEATLWNKIRKKSLGVEFHRQIPMLDYIADFYCHEIGLAIEVDGSSHDSRFWEDAKRQGRLENFGVHFLRFTNQEIFSDMDGVIGTIQEYVHHALR